MHLYGNSRVFDWSHELPMRMDMPHLGLLESYVTQFWDVRHVVRSNGWTSVLGCYAHHDVSSSHITRRSIGNWPSFSSFCCNPAQLTDIDGNPRELEPGVGCQTGENEISKEIITWCYALAASATPLVQGEALGVISRLQGALGDAVFSKPSWQRCCMQDFIKVNQACESEIENFCQGMFLGMKNYVWNARQGVIQVL